MNIRLTYRQTVHVGLGLQLRTLKDVEDRSDVTFLDDDAVCLELDGVDAIDDFSNLDIIQVLQEVVVEHRLSY